MSVRVELVSGRGMELWPRPGRVFAVARSHTFGQLADAIDLAFARWDLAHMHMFTLADGTEITALEQWAGEAPDGITWEIGLRSGGAPLLRVEGSRYV